MLTIIIVIGILVLAATMAFSISCCKVSSMCSREEEKLYGHTEVRIHEENK